MISRLTVGSPDRRRRLPLANRHLAAIELEATLAQPGLSKGFMLRYTEEKLGLWCGGELKRGEHRRAKISKTNEDCARDLAPGKWQIEVK